MLVANVKERSRERIVSRELGPVPRRRRPEWCGIYRAETDPSLLDSANVLRFGALATWPDECQVWQIVN
jgi:hypothetical protein